MNFEVKGQGYNIDTYCFDFPYMDLVIVDIKHKFPWYMLPNKILY